MTLQFGWENDDFIKFRHTILAEHENLRVVFKVKDNDGKYNQDLFGRLIWYKAIKRIKICLQAYPLGGYMKFPL